MGSDQRALVLGERNAHTWAQSRVSPNRWFRREELASPSTAGIPNWPDPTTESPQHVTPQRAPPDSKPPPIDSKSALWITAGFPQVRLGAGALSGAQFGVYGRLRMWAEGAGRIPPSVTLEPPFLAAIV
jgi:hypothetical protein